MSALPCDFKVILTPLSTKEGKVHFKMKPHLLSWKKKKKRRKVTPGWLDSYIASNGLMTSLSTELKIKPQRAEMGAKY